MTFRLIPILNARERAFAEKHPDTQLGKWAANQCRCGAAKFPEDERCGECCPKCEGCGSFGGTVIACGLTNSSVDRRTWSCRACDGTGKVSAERLASIKAGAAARWNRVHGQRYATQALAARALGVSVQDYSAWENYGIPLPAADR